MTAQHAGELLDADAIDKFRDGDDGAECQVSSLGKTDAVAANSSLVMAHLPVMPERGVESNGTTEANGKADKRPLYLRMYQEETFVAIVRMVGYPRVGTHGLTIPARDLALLLDGIDLASVKRRRRYRRPNSSAAASGKSL
jgi:hypothetical protein